MVTQMMNNAHSFQRFALQGKVGNQDFPAHRNLTVSDNSFFCE